MSTNSLLSRTLWTITLATALTLGAISHAAAHCDTLDGPVVQDARKALDTRDVTPVLKWVREKDEKGVRAAFAKAVAAKGKQGASAEESKFFATLVKIHRAGEGAPFTGLKPAGSVEPAVAEADKALASGSSDALVKIVAESVEHGIKERFDRVAAAYRHKDESVTAGRKFVEAYVDYTHYVERLHQDTAAKGARGEHHEGHAAEHGEHAH